MYDLPDLTTPEVHHGHARILEAFQTGDAAMMDRANRDHLEWEGAQVVRALKDAGVLSD